MRLIDALSLRLDQMLASRQKIGKVTAVVGNKVTVDVENGSITIARNAAYTPAVNDIVVINAMIPGSWFVLCKFA